MRRIYSVVLLACAFLVSCGDDEGFTSAPIPAGVLTVVNAIPTSPELSVGTNNLRAGNISFGEATPGNSVLPQIPLDFRVSFFNNGVDQTVLEDEITLGIDFRQTIVLTGTIDMATAVNIVEPPFTYPAGSTDTRIRFMNATSNVASATLVLTNPNGTDETIALTRGQPTSLLTVAAGAGVEIEIRDTSSNALLWRSGEFTLSSRADRFFILRDYFGPGDETVRLQSINDPSGTSLFINEELIAGLRFVNQTANRGPLDFLVDGTLAASLDFGEISSFIEFAPGSKTITVTPAGDATTELNSADRTLFTGTFHTLHAAPNVDSTGVGTGFLIENRRPVATQAIVNLTKLAPAVTTVDLYFQNQGEALTGSADVGGLSDFSSGTLALRPGVYDFYVTEQGNTNVLIGPQTLTLDALGIYTLQITESAGGGTPLQLALFDDFQN